MSEREDIRPDGGRVEDGTRAAPPREDDVLAQQDTEQLEPAPEREQTVPGTAPAPVDRTVVLPPDALAAPDDAAGGYAGATAPDYSPRPVAVRRPDGLGGLLLVLAGIAAAVSLLLRWLDADDATGLDLVRRGLDDLGVGLGEPIDTGFWQPLAIVFGGAVLFVLGLWLFVPARRHRLVGLLALLIAGTVTAGVLVPIADAGWSLDPFATGFWSALVVAALGLLGGLKALLTGRTYR